MRARIVTLLLGGAVLAACSSGESIINAGNDPLPTATTAAPGPPTSTGPTLPGETTTSTAAITTTTTPLASLPPCPVDALDDVTAPVDITFWYGLNTETDGHLQALTEQYHASQDRVRVRLENQVGYRETIDKFVQSSQDSRPSMVMMPEYVLAQMADSGAMIPVGACIEAGGYDTSEFLPGVLGAYETGGVQWSMPFNVSNPVLFYNAAMFEAAGLDPAAPPASIEELRAAAQAIVDSGAATYGLAVDAGQDSGGSWFLEQWLAKAGEPYADNGNGRVARATRVLYSGEEGVALLTAVQSMIQDGLAVNVGDNASGSDQLFKLADPGQPAAMTLASSGGVGAVIDVLDGGFIPGITSAQLGVGAMPGPDGNPLTIVGGGSLYIVADKGDPVAAAVWDYVQFLVDAQTQSTWAAETGYVPVREDAVALDPIRSTYETDPRFRVGYDSLRDAPRDDPTAVGPVLGPMREVRSVTASGVAAIFGGADVAATLAATAQQSDALIADYNARN